MPLFNLNDLQNVADGLKNREERAALEKSTADKRRALNHNVNKAERQAVQSATVAEREERLKAGDAQLAVSQARLREATVQQQRSAEARTKLNADYNTVQTEAGIAAGQQNRAINAAAEKEQEKIRAAQDNLAYGTQKGITETQRAAAHAKQQIDHNAAKAQAESGMIAGAEKVHTENQRSLTNQAAQHAQQRSQDNYRIAEESRSTWKAFGNMAGNLVQTGIKAYDNHQTQQANAAVQGVGQRIQNETAGMDAAQIKEWVDKGGVERAFAPAQARVDNIKNPLDRSQVQAQLDGQKASAQAQVMGQQTRAVINERNAKIGDLQEDAAAAVAQGADPVQVGSALQQNLQPYMEGSPGTLPGRGLNKQDVDDMVASTMFKGEYSNKLGAGDVSAVAKMLKREDAPEHLSANQIKAGMTWVRGQTKAAKNEAEVLAKREENAMSLHTDGIISSGQWHHLGNRAGLGVAAGKYGSGLQAVQNHIAKKSNMPNGQRQSTRDEIKSFYRPEKTRADYVYNRQVDAIFKAVNAETAVGGDPLGLVEKMHGEVASEGLTNQERKARFGRLTTVTQARQLGNRLSQGFNTGKLDEIYEELGGQNGKYQGGSFTDVVNEGLDAYISDAKSDKAKAVRVREANLIRLQLSPKTRNLIDEERYRDAVIQTADNPLPKKLETAKPEDYDALSFLPGEQQDAVTEAQQIMAWHQSGKKSYTGTPQEQTTAREEEFQKILDGYGRKAAGLRTAIEEEQGFAVNPYDQKEYPLDRLMADGRKPYISKTTLEEIPAEDLKLNVRKAQVWQNPATVKAQLWEDLDTETQQYMTQLDSQNVKYDFGYKVSRNDSTKFELFITPLGDHPDVGHKVKLKGGIVPDIVQGDVFRTGRMIPQIDKDIPDPTIYGGDLDRLITKTLKDKQLRPGLKRIGKEFVDFAESVEDAADIAGGWAETAFRRAIGLGTKITDLATWALFTEKKDAE